jgi:hypothetical protein
MCFGYNCFIVASHHIIEDRTPAAYNQPLLWTESSPESSPESTPGWPDMTVTQHNGLLTQAVQRPAQQNSQGAESGSRFSIYATMFAAITRTPVHSQAERGSKFLLCGCVCRHYKSRLAVHRTALQNSQPWRVPCSSATNGNNLVTSPIWAHGTESMLVTSSILVCGTESKIFTSPVSPLQVPSRLTRMALQEPAQIHSRTLWLLPFSARLLQVPFMES